MQRPVIVETRDPQMFHTPDNDQHKLVSMWMRIGIQVAPDSRDAIMAIARAAHRELGGGTDTDSP